MRSRWRLALVIILALLVPIVPFAIIGELPGDRWLTASGSDSLAFGAAGAALLSSDILLPIPSSIIGTLLGARLGLIAGFFWAWLGLTVGSIAGYLAGRFALPSIAASVPKTPGGMLVFLSRPVPILAEAISLTAGAARMPLATLVTASAAGNAVYAGIMAGTGATLLPAGFASAGLAVAMLLPVVAWLLWRYLAPRGKA